MSNRNKEGRFTKNSTPHNKGKKLEDYLDSEKIDKIQKTQYKTGDDHTGKNHISWRGGVQKNKKDATYIWTGNKQRARRPRVVYEQNFGAIPKGFVVIHKDQDKDNDDPSNLEAISRAELLKRNRE